MDEDAPVGPKDLPESEWEGYGPNKVLAERIVQDGFGARTLITRPPVIVGPGDRTDRFTYWVDRLDDGGAVLVQGIPQIPYSLLTSGSGRVLRASAGKLDDRNLQHRGTGIALGYRRPGSWNQGDHVFSVHPPVGAVGFSD